MLGMFGWSICLTILCVKGGERHVWDVEKLGVDSLAPVQLLNWLSQVFGILGIAAGKISVSALLLTMLRLTDLRWHCIYLWIVTIVLTSAIAVSCSFLTMLQCSPPAALWDPKIQGKCIDSRVMSGYGIFTGAFNTFADGCLAILPTTVILSGQQPNQEVAAHHRIRAQHPDVHMLWHQDPVPGATGEPNRLHLGDI
ncbi:hypothetical protein FJTKL_15195 [Diaporthe vaccinii]|uniref:Rhodopsin domain-containing protein n=1 Tax=Diaporthe vaccinii TaxID=105482 RepID=A0ABR4E5S2_9PEZI